MQEKLFTEYIFYLQYLMIIYHASMKLIMNVAIFNTAYHDGNNCYTATLKPR
jgi:hypothetical protein